ncbi:MAG: GTPase RsgA [Ideonella sp.]|nr:GTPase RsgA [Ideonella sp.]
MKHDQSPAFFTTVDADIDALRPIGLSAQLETTLRSLLAQIPPDLDPPVLTRRAGRVVELQREGVTLHDGVRAWPARLLPRLRHDLEAAGDALAVGDWVLAEHHGHDPWWIGWRLPPRSQVTRRLHDGRQKLTRAVLVANVDTALVVMGLDGDFNLRRLDRYLALVRGAGLAGVVVLTKADRCDRVDTRLVDVRARIPADVAVVAVDARDAATRHALGPWLQPGQTLVTLGSSGAGKSTITNTLCALGETGLRQPGGDEPAAARDDAVPAEGDPTRRLQPTGRTRSGDGRGRHTTTSRSLHRTPEGACLIDTPGIRGLRLDLEAEAIAGAFEDVARLAPRCRFRDCRHADEPGCAVRETVPPDRLRSFHKLQREAQRDQLTLLERQAEHAVWRQRSKAARARSLDKRR